MFHVPPLELVPTCVRGVVSGATGGAALTAVQADVVTAFTTNLFHAPLDPSGERAIDPEELAAAVTDPALRHQLVVAMVGLSLMAHPPDLKGPARINRYAKALGVDEPMVAAARRYVEGNRKWMLFDFARHSAFRPLLQREVDDRGIVPLLRQVGALKGVTEDKDLVARFRTLEDYPAGSWGRALWDFYEAEAWPLPGEKGSVPQATSEHDWIHVLSGYSPTPLGEIQVTAFMAANAPDDVAFSILFLAMGVYETGAIRIPLGPEPRRHALDRTRWRRPVRRCPAPRCRLPGRLPLHGPLGPRRAPTGRGPRGVRRRTQAPPRSRSRPEPPH